MMRWNIRSIITTSSLALPGQGGDDGVDVVDAAAPRAAADLLERGPQPRVGRQIGIGGEVGTRRARGEHARAFLGGEALAAVTHEIDAAFQTKAIDHDPNQIA